jgi:hypothetical protein
MCCVCSVRGCPYTGLGIYRDLHEPDPALRYKISGGSPAGCCKFAAM